MALSITADAIVLAINSAIKLGDRIQRAYANSIKAKTILLPLPPFDGTPNFERAHRFFKFDDQGKEFREKIERIQILFTEHEEFGLGSSDQDEYIDFYIKLTAQLEKERRQAGPEDDSEINLESMLALLQVRQWETGKAPRNSPVKLVAGTLVEIGIDYFNQVPGALNPRSSTGRVMQRFLAALDGIQIAEADDLREVSEQLVPQLFIAAAESVGELSKDISADEKVQDFIAATSKNLAADLIERTRTMDPDATAETVRWGQLVLRSMVKNAGQYVFNSPAELFETDEGVYNLIQKTGNVILNAILEDPHQLDLKRGFNVDTLDQVVRSALQVVSEHPEMISRQVGLQNIISGVSAAIAEAKIPGRPDLLPELVRLILEYTAGNLHLLILRDTPSDPATDDAAAENWKHLLVMATREVLLAISQPVPDGRWKLQLPKGQLIGIVENVLDEVVRNPHWILNEVGDATLLRATLDATFRALAGLPPDQRLNSDVLEMILQVNIRTVVTRQAVLDRVRWGTDTEEVSILQRSLDLVFHFVFDNKQVAAAERVHLLSELLRYVSQVILTHHPDKKGLLLIDMILFQDPDVDYSLGFRPELADELINAALEVMAQQPELITGDRALRSILSGVAGALHASAFREAGILTELVRLSLFYSAENAQLIVRAEADQPKYLLVVALRQLLSTVSAEPPAGQWRPRLSPAQLLSITELVFDRLVQHPQWLVAEDEEETLFGAVLQAIFQALRALPADERLQLNTLEAVIKLSLSTAVSHPQLLQPIRWGTDEEEAAILQHALDIVTSFAFERSRTSGGLRLQLFVDLLHYVLEILMSRYPDKRGLLLLDLIVFEDPDVDFSQGFRPELYDRLIEAAIRVLDYRPDLVTGNEVFQHLIEVVMGELKASGFKQPGILPELLRLILEATAENISLVIKSEEGRPKYLLAVAAGTLLRQLSRPPAGDERWRPELNTPQLLRVVEEVLDYLVLHPQLVTEELREGTIFSEAVQALLNGLAGLPRAQRLQPDSLTWLLRSGLQAAVRSRELLDRVNWGPEEEEVVILEKALELVFAHIFPAQGPARADALDGLLEYVLEFLLQQHQDKKVLLILYLILFELPELGPMPLPGKRDPEELIDAALQLLRAHPELISRDAVWQKIIQDTAGALQTSGLPLPELLPEMLRLTLVHTAENVDLLTGVKAGSKPYVLAVAMEQVLLAVAKKPRSGSWKPQLSTSMILEILEMCLETMLQNPLWTRDDMLRVVLESVFEALQKVPEDRKWPYASLRLLLQNVLKAISFRKSLAIEVVHRRGRRQIIGLTYALEGLMVTLYPASDANGTATASWTLTQTQVLDALIDSFLQGLVRGPITKASIDEALEPVAVAMADLAENSAFSLEELLDELEQ